MTQYLALCALSFLASYLSGGTVPCSMYSIIGILQSAYSSGSRGTGSSVDSFSGSSWASFCYSFCYAAATEAAAAAAVRRVTQVKLQVAEGIVSSCLVAISILGFSIPSTGFTLLT